MNSSSFFEDLRGLHHIKGGEWVPTVISQGACPTCMGTPATAQASGRHPFSLAGWTHCHLVETSSIAGLKELGSFLGEQVYLGQARPKEPRAVASTCSSDSNGHGDP